MFVIPDLLFFKKYNVDHSINLLYVQEKAKISEGEASTSK